MIEKQYYTVTIKLPFEVEDKKGNSKTKYRKEKYLVEAVNPTDIDVKIAKYIGAGEEYEIVTINQANIIDIIS
jgi:hypothetical protein